MPSNNIDISGPIDYLSCNSSVTMMSMDSSNLDQEMAQEDTIWWHIEIQISNYLLRESLETVKSPKSPEKLKNSKFSKKFNSPKFPNNLKRPKATKNLKVANTNIPKVNKGSPPLVTPFYVISPEDYETDDELFNCISSISEAFVIPPTPIPIEVPPTSYPSH